MFDTKEGLVINEIAPRVHNSGHYTSTACSLSQFEAHLLAGTQSEIPQIYHDPYFAMVNLLGKSTRTPKVPQNLTGDLHWYGKTENRPRRKMGHVSLGGDRGNVLNILLKERKEIKL